MSKLRNKIASRCYRCGEMCNEGEGHVELVTDVHYAKWPNAALKKWLVQHLDCAIVHRGTRTHYLYAPAVAPTGEAIEAAKAASRARRDGRFDDDEVMSGSELSAILPNLVL